MEQPPDALAGGATPSLADYSGRIAEPAAVPTIVTDRPCSLGIFGRQAASGQDIGERSNTGHDQLGRIRRIVERPPPPIHNGGPHAAGPPAVARPDITMAIQRLRCSRRSLAAPAARRREAAVEVGRAGTLSRPVGVQVERGSCE
jgi:hypothetical protein